ncbi:FtsH protease activity modulator HflK [bacterium]|nr:FtsH protease activity modulator HflK [bacterium]
MATIDITPDQAGEVLKKITSKAGLIIPALFVVVGVISSYYTVPADSEAVILRFGKYERTTTSGLHFKLPFGLEQKYILPVKRQLKMEFGFSTSGSTNVYQASAGEQEQEQSMITGDKNAALVEWVVQYRIDDPEKYLFRVKDPEFTLRDASESVMREVVGDRTVDEVITIGRQSIEVDALRKMDELVRLYGLGLQITSVQLKNVSPPRPVQSSFNEVNQAQQERARMINVAKGEYNKSVPKTKGMADQQVSRAEGDAKQRVNEASGDAERFLALYKEYAKAPAITRQRLYLERISEVLPRLKSKIIMDEKATAPVPLLDLNNALKK